MLQRRMTGVRYLASGEHVSVGFRVVVALVSTSRRGTAILFALILGEVGIIRGAVKIYQ